MLHHEHNNRLEQQYVLNPEYTTPLKTKKPESSLLLSIGSCAVRFSSDSFSKRESILINGMLEQIYQHNEKNSAGS